ncbi:hypothetical protein DACRYDRAFT_112693 [Dacryopinax primogenitus]|uniref:Uncharacterized protein n=1 Tax=Dacryopinax primogenitus (strain DJM 731) TaxID=1858805 RepID=M5FTE0_DACPD|nr:uncharacterized protein DACRYDRAFT_112693 [Dacryopinax primogenitus]EJT96511.1 hypothetical protein DACRYDRAFT_112693 [Dacryopinax primogenitus]
MILPNLAILLSVSSAVWLVAAAPTPPHYVDDSSPLSLWHISTADPDLAAEPYAWSLYSTEEPEPVLATRITERPR